MAKAKKNIVPFFKLRWQVQDTLEAVTNELLMTMSVLRTAIQLGDLKEPTKQSLQERLNAITKLCSEDDEE